MPLLGMTLDLSTSLEQLIQHEISPLRAFPEDKTCLHQDAGSWCSKEELGHLIDSAANNHQRFVRASIQPEYDGPGYAQDAWVASHGYQDLDWEKLVSFWYGYNLLLAEVIDRIPADKFETPCKIGDDAPVTLRFVIKDYVLHMRHHLDHILGREIITQYR